MSPHKRADPQYQTIFDAKRDNKGKGISLEYLLKLLKRIDKK